MEAQSTKSWGGTWWEAHPTRAHKHTTCRRFATAADSKLHHTSHTCNAKIILVFFFFFPFLCAGSSSSPPNPSGAELVLLHPSWPGLGARIKENRAGARAAGGL